MTSRKFIVAVVLAILTVAGTFSVLPQPVRAGSCMTCPPAPPVPAGGGKDQTRQRRPTPTDKPLPTAVSTKAPPATSAAPAVLLPTGGGSGSGITSAGPSLPNPSGPVQTAGPFNLPEPLSMILGAVMLAAILIGLLLVVRGRQVLAVQTSSPVYDGSDKMGAQPHMDDGSDKMGAQPHMDDGSDKMGAQPHMNDGSSFSAIDPAESPASQMVGNPDLNPGSSHGAVQPTDMPGESTTL